MVAMVPESQLWTLEEPNRSRIARGLAWAAANKPKETDVEALWKAQPNRARRVRARRR